MYMIRQKKNTRMRCPYRSAASLIKRQNSRRSDFDEKNRVCLVIFLKNLNLIKNDFNKNLLWGYFRGQT